MGPIYYAAGGVGLILIILLGVQTYRLTDTERLLAEAKTLSVRLTDNNKTLTDNQKMCQAEIDFQNAQVRDAAAKLKAANDKATADAQKAADSLRGATKKAGQTQAQLRMFLSEAMASEPTILACTAALNDGRRVDQ